MKLDGNDIKTINLSYLRSLIGVVNQEPVLFAGTIAENIAYGREGVSRGEIEDAAKMANAHDFITDFPQVANFRGFFFFFRSHIIFTCNS